MGDEQAGPSPRSSDRRPCRVLGDGRSSTSTPPRPGAVWPRCWVLLSYVVDAGLSARWIVIEGDPAFFELTKRIHNHLYGTPGDGGPLGPAEHEPYEATLAPEAEALEGFLRPGDIALIHDPQPAGLAGAAAHADAIVVWRCHVGVDVQNEYSERGWEFLRPYVELRRPLRVRMASSPPTAPKTGSPPSPRRSTRSWQRPGSGARDRGGHHHAPASSTVERATPLSLAATDPRPRWIERARSCAAGPARSRCPLGHPDLPLGPDERHGGGVAGVRRPRGRRVGSPSVLAGPAAGEVADDPEAGRVLEDCVRLWESLPPEDQRRVSLASLPMDGPEENAAMVNALQRHSAVVVQKEPRRGLRPHGRGGAAGSGQWWPARSAASGIRSSTAESACCSPIRWTYRRSVSWSPAPSATRILRDSSARRAGSTPSTTTWATRTWSDGWGARQTGVRVGHRSGGCPAMSSFRSATPGAAADDRRRGSRVVEGCSGFVRFTGEPGFDNVLRSECSSCRTRWSLAQAHLLPERPTASRAQETSRSPG